MKHQARNNKQILLTKLFFNEQSVNAYCLKEYGGDEENTP